MSLQRCLPGVVASALALMLPAHADATTNDGAGASVGVATWYGSRHEGRRTSNGSVFHQEEMTAASSRLPLGSKVRVTLHETGNSVVVVVNDRMGGRALIDLSSGAAKRIGLYARGRGTVTVEDAGDEPVEVAEATALEPGQPRAGEPMEVAEASEDETADIVSSAPRGQLHRHHATRSGGVARQYYRAPSVVLARHSVQPRAARRKL